jgi:hypothetical protein
MLLQKIGFILTTEIKWGRIALLALGASMVALLVSGGAFNLLSLTVFSIAGIFVERLAPKRPYLNALCYGLLGVLFYVVLFILQVLGLGAAPVAEEMLWLTFSVAIVVVPQALIGTWIGTSIRKFSQVAAEARKDGGAPPTKGKKDGAPPADRKPARPPQKKPEQPLAPAQRRKKG